MLDLDIFPQVRQEELVVLLKFNNENIYPHTHIYVFLNKLNVYFAKYGHFSIFLCSNICSGLTNCFPYSLFCMQVDFSGQ